MIFQVNPHKFCKRKYVPWLVCQGCGLIALRNPFSEWCVKMGCDYEDHPDFKNKRANVSPLR